MVINGLVTVMAFWNDTGLFSVHLMHHLAPKTKLKALVSPDSPQSIPQTENFLISCTQSASSAILGPQKTIIFCRSTNHSKLSLD